MIFGNKIVNKIVSQFKMPTGFLGSIVGIIMSYRKSNLERGKWAVELLNLQPNNKVLEVGFGPGNLTLYASYDILMHKENGNENNT
jgi:hypothetical protein